MHPDEMPKAADPAFFLQPKITGYRQLVPAETEMINRAKALGAQFEELNEEIRAYLADQAAGAAKAQQSADLSDGVEFLRLVKAEPGRWLAMGRTDIQVGVMKIVRAIAQPAS